MKQVRALGLFSGGLDSMLAVALLRAQGIAVTGMVWTTPFFSAEQAIQSAAALDLQLRLEDLTDHFLPLLYHPPHGFGRGLNPCIDCHTLMLRQTGQIMAREGYDFIFTGEVLGQRPFSQHRGALNLIARESNYADLILRPLSARLLKPSRPELQGLVDREKLLNLNGRGRKRQIALAAHFGITVFPAPAGGCLLTEPRFASRLKELLNCQPEVKRRDLELLKWGRHFRLSPASRAIVGRDERENEIIYSWRQPSDLLLQIKDYPGPLVLIPGEVHRGQLVQAATLCASYSNAPYDLPLTVEWEGPLAPEVIVAYRKPRDIFKNILL
jgi:tRNA U34 2-thiouridine synthase MnmA/TrmU